MGRLSTVSRSKVQFSPAPEPGSSPSTLKAVSDNKVDVTISKKKSFAKLVVKESKRKLKSEQEDECGSCDESTPQKTKPKMASAIESYLPHWRRMWELAHRCKKYVGAHVSMSGGVENAIVNTLAIGGTGLALFLKSQRKWDSPPLAEVNAAAFRDICQKYGFNARHILPHGSYLVNLGSSNPDLLQKSRTCFLEDLQRCERLGITLYNFHPGSAVDKTAETAKKDCISRIAESINWAHLKTTNIVCVLECMAGQGSTVGGRFEELAEMIAHVHDKKRVGICLDTCHLFAAGYDISTAGKFDAVLREFDRVVGLSYLRGMHLNDSKSKCGSHLDRHENIGKGYIGLECFRFIMNDSRFNDIPMVLETPVVDDEIYKKEIELLYSLVENA